jgi:hypothetical protein
LIQLPIADNIESDSLAGVLVPRCSIDQPLRDLAGLGEVFSNSRIPKAVLGAILQLNSPNFNK